MAPEEFHRLMRDPVLRDAWKTGWKHAHTEPVFDDSIPIDVAAHAMYRKMPLNNAYLYCQNHHYKRPVLIYLLAMPAFDFMSPKEISEKFGEAVASLVAEMKLLDDDDAVAGASPLAQEASRAVFGFFGMTMDADIGELKDGLTQMNEGMAILEQIPATLDQINERIEGALGRMDEWDQKRVLARFDITGLKFN